MTRKLLILDLDETLIFASERSLDRRADFAAGPYSVYLRPGVQEFLAFCREHFDVAVWTSSTESYAANVVTNVFGAEYPLKFVWSRSAIPAKPEDIHLAFVGAGPKPLGGLLSRAKSPPNLLGEPSASAKQDP